MEIEGQAYTLSHSLKKYRCLFTLFLFFFYPIFAQGQDRCGTVAYQLLQQDRGVVKEHKDQFEKWIGEKILFNKSIDKQKRWQASSYKIQVVVHIIHRGETIGTGTNISDEQIVSQIEVLNKDFKRQNEDAVNTPTEFQALAGASSIEFVLAKTDPTGMPTSGIIRVRGSKSAYILKDDSELKAQSYWPAENYLNIWVCNLIDRYGYTQFPVSTLPGMENSNKNRLTDGIVISYEAFGSSDYGKFFLNSSYNKGRTTTHEMGHFFGLRHTWGDEEDCNGTDYVDDTPPQANQTLGCPSHPQKECPADNPGNKMFQDFLDYTDDECMNLFTKGQIDRMMTILENSPRRASLLIPLSPGPQEVQFPKLFSPNGDGVNDYWLWTNTLDYQGCKLIVYNRFGKVVYEITSYDNTWDGRSNNGQPLEEEAYYYTLTCENQKEITGAVRIIR